MDVMFSLINSFCGDTQKLSTCKLIQKSISDFEFYNCKQGTAINDAVSIINNYLNASKSRLNGLLLLDKMLKQCSTSVFEENCLTWIRLLSTIMQSYDPPSIKNICHLVFAQLLKHSSQFPELCKEFSTSYLPGIITGLIATKSEFHETALHLLAQCMLIFSGACGPYRGKIENFLTELLENENSDIQNAAISCYTILPVLGGGGSQGVKYSEGWLQLVNKVITSWKSTLGSLYQCLNFEDNISIHTGCIKLGRIRNEEPYRTYQLVTRYHTTCKILNSFLSMKFPVTVNVPVREILGIVQKALSVTPKSLMTRPTQERTTLATVLPSVYESSLKVIETSVQCLSGNLIPYSRSINQCLVQVLATTDMPKNYGCESPYRVVRQCAWQTLTTWLHSVGISSGVEDIVDDIIKQAIHDFVPVDDTVKVQNSSSMKLSEVSEHFHAKKKKKGGSSHIGLITTQRKVDENACSTTCIYALNALMLLIKLLAPLLSVQVFRSLLNSLMGTILKVSSNSTNKELPYGNADCRIKLYETVLVLVEVNHPKVASPIQAAVNIFQRGTQDNNETVSIFCKEALSSIENIIHPRAPTVYFPISDLAGCQFPVQTESKNSDIFRNTTLYAVHEDLLKNIDESNSVSRNINQNFNDVTEDVDDKCSSENTDYNDNKSDQLSTELVNINRGNESVKSTSDILEQKSPEPYFTNNDDLNANQQIDSAQTKSESLFTDNIINKNQDDSISTNEEKSISTNEETIVKDLQYTDNSEPLSIDSQEEPGTSGIKRKWNDDDEYIPDQSFKRQESDESNDGSVEMMLQSFVDAGPDSE